MSGTEREWASRGTSLYQFLRRAQQRTQYLWRGVLYFLHSVHCHASLDGKGRKVKGRRGIAQIEREETDTNLCGDLYVGVIAQTLRVLVRLLLHLK